MKHVYTIMLSAFMLGGTFSLSAQNNTLAAGGVGTGASGSVSYSIGQIDYIAASGTNGKITQGLQQPYEILVMTGVTVTDVNLSASAYPNPTTDFVNLKVSNLSAATMMYVVYDMNGKLVKQEKLSGAETTISLSELSKATYILKVLDNNKEIKTFKIVKN